MPEPASGGLLISYRCNAKCAHCYLNCSPKKRGKMEPQEAREYLREFSQTKIPKQEIHITGGEPFLDFGHLCSILEECRDSPFKGTGFSETNAFWATTESVCIKRLEKNKRIESG